MARSMEGDGLVVEMNVFNADSFFSDDERVVKAVLFTRKAEIPALWRQVAMANLRIASFGLVRHSEEDLMQRFQLTPEQLPRVVIFLPGLATNQTPSSYFCHFPSLCELLFIAQAAGWSLTGPTISLTSTVS